MNPTDRKPLAYVFRASEEDKKDFEGSIQAHEVELIYGEATPTQPGDDDGTPYDAIVIPLRLADGSSGITRCIALKAQEATADVPIIGFCQSRERAVLQAFYDVGADFVFAPPFSSDQFVLQLKALARKREENENALTKLRETSGISQSVMSAFNLTREGLCIFNLQFEPYFLNEAARLLFGVEDIAERRSGQHVEAQIEKYLRKFKSESDGLSPRKFEVNLSRLDGQSFFASVTTATLLAENSVPFAYAVQIVDLSELDLLSTTLMQAQRTRSLALLAAAGAFHLLDVESRQVRSPLVFLEDQLAGSDRSTPLNATLTSLLEFLDLVISPDIVVKVNVRQDCRLGLRVSDFFRMVGQLLLYAVEFAGRAGECIVSFSEFEPGEGVTLLIQARSRKVTPFLENDYLSQIIQGNVQALGGTSTEGKLSYGLNAAQQIASEYRTEVQYRQSGDSELKLRVRIPIDQRSLRK